ncbi:VOC family protein [Pedobacter sp. L105]|uniref:VOC family protein n=1 Tax=Pedobacter sp. L105 TaxID=1641871 RepID=UPI00131C2CFC|nr:VOC family protein [Pedobacter sp. L105]
MTQINVYLIFDGNCAEAMNFYQDCLGGELILNKVEGSPLEAECAAGMEDKIMHAHLASNSIIIMASDRLMPGDFIRGNGYSLALQCSSEEEINTFFTKLSAGGTIGHPLKEQFWGAIFGMFTDKFGVEWMLNFDKAST